MWILRIQRFPGLDSLVQAKDMRPLSTVWATASSSCRYECPDHAFSAYTATCLSRGAHNQQCLMHLPVGCFAVLWDLPRLDTSTGHKWVHCLGSDVEHVGSSLVRKLQNWGCHRQQASLGPTLKFLHGHRLGYFTSAFLTMMVNEQQITQITSNMHTYTQQYRQ